MICSICHSIGHNQGKCATPLIVFVWRDWRPQGVQVYLSFEKWQIGHQLYKVQDIITGESYYYLEKYIPIGKH